MRSARGAPARMMTKGSEPATMSSNAASPNASPARANGHGGAETVCLATAPIGQGETTGAPARATTATPGAPSCGYGSVSIQSADAPSHTAFVRGCRLVGR